MRSNLIRLVASRLLLRMGPPPPRAVLGSRLGLGLTLVCGVAIVWGQSWLGWAIGFGLGSMLAVASLCVRVFPASMAVSVMGVALSCASLMTVLGVTRGFEHELTNSVARVNGHLLLTKYGLDFFEYEELADRWVADADVVAASPFAFSMVALVKSDPPLRPGEEMPAPASPEGDDDEGPPRGPIVVMSKGLIPERAGALEGFSSSLDRGDPAALRPGDSAHPPGLVLGFRLAKELGAEPGDFVRVVVPAEIDGRDGPIKEPKHAVFEVLDLMRTGTSEIDRNLAMMHISAAQALFFQERRVTGIEFQLHDPGDADDVADRIAQRQGYPYRVSTWRETNASLLMALQQVRAVLSVILGLMILVAASSLIASLLLIVRAKRHDIAVILATGGERSLVFWLFESVGVGAGVIGAAVGVSLGALYCAVIAAYDYPLVGDVYPVDHLPVLLRPLDVLGPAVVAVLLCAVASGPCAMLAARVRLLDAMSR